MLALFEDGPLADVLVHECFERDRSGAGADRSIEGVRLRRRFFSHRIEGS